MIRLKIMLRMFCSLTPQVTATTLSTASTQLRPCKSSAARVHTPRKRVARTSSSRSVTDQLLLSARLACQLSISKAKKLSPTLGHSTVPLPIMEICSAFSTLRTPILLPLIRPTKLLHYLPTTSTARTLQSPTVIHLLLTVSLLRRLLRLNGMARLTNLNISARRATLLPTTKSPTLRQRIRPNCSA